MTPKALPWLHRLHEHGVITHLDYYFAVSMAAVFPHDHDLLPVSCALVSRELADGKICLDIKKISGTTIGLTENIQDTVQLPGFAVWIKALESSAMVGKPQDTDSLCFPLVLDADGCLYLSKYHDFQHRLVQALSERMRSHPPPLDQKFVQAAVDETFKGQHPDHVQHQKKAVITAFSNNFTVISGGPGTGKTHISRVIRQVIQDHAAANGLPMPRFLSVAPTGKAAVRLQDGATIHSVLIPKKNQPGFVHGKNNLLAADVVIVDEASMIDMALMTRLFEAIPMDARVILLGDENQLSPVQAGAVFSDICRTDALKNRVVFLAYNFRSGGKTGIENLANAIRKNDVAEVTTILTKNRYPDLLLEQPEKGYSRTLAPHIKEGYAGFMRQQGLTASLAAMDNFRILCAHKKGEYGTLQINHLCEKILRRVFDSGIRERFLKQLVMITANDYTRGLFNGDTGVVLDQKGILTAGFTMEDGMVKKFRYPDLPSHEPAFGVTIHKSQGSEFNTVLIVIPDQLSRVVTRQLLYTGVTRARQKAIIVGGLDVIQEAMAVSLEKTSNLPYLLDRELKNSAAGHVKET
ncbi:MAG: exodeoxyribonuclease V subunit alpha [Desulfotignum sp.]|jgi:exodeoxyribonuclease V alpha subunit|nr:exodeoxyribonuclease V subunit alpha [Desulfotignum sp.]